jgi:hypothetical protein
LRQVLNPAAWFIAGLEPRDHIMETLCTLHWLPVEYRIQLKLGVLMHAMVHNRVPSYLSDVVVPVSSLTGRTRLHSVSISLFDIPAVRTNLDRRAFSVAGPGFWNTLPADLRAVCGFFSFKRQLMAFLFKLAFDSV